MTTALGDALVLHVGTGFALSFPSLNVEATAGVADRAQGLASGPVNTSFPAGEAIVLAVVSAVVTSRPGSDTNATSMRYGFRPSLAVDARRGAGPGGSPVGAARRRAARARMIGPCGRLRRVRRYRDCLSRRENERMSARVGMGSPRPGVLPPRGSGTRGEQRGGCPVPSISRITRWVRLRFTTPRAAPEPPRRRRTIAVTRRVPNRG